MTFSIIARCPETGQFGATVSSSSPAVAARCIRVRPGVGAAASQNITDPRLGTMALDLMAAGNGPKQALDALPAPDSDLAGQERRNKAMMKYIGQRREMDFERYGDRAR